MDTTSFKFSSDKNSFSHKSETYILEGNARNNNVLYRCKIEGCNASIKLNSDLTKIVSGSSIHNHLKRFSPQSNTQSSKDKPIKPQTHTFENQKNLHIISHQSKSSPNTKPKSHAASHSNSQSTPKSSLTDKDNRVSHNYSSDSTFTDKTLQSQDKCENWINARNGFIDKIASQEIEITQLKSIIASLQHELSTIKNPQSIPPNSIPTRTPTVHTSWAPAYMSSGGICYLVGDSHVRGLVQQFQSLVSSKWSFQSIFQPGAGFKTVADTHTDSPSLITPKPEDAVILMCGTNDICSSTWDDVQNGLESLLDKFHLCQSLCLVGVPLRYDSRGLNRHIIRFNTKVKNFVLSKNKDVFYLDPTHLIKPKAYRLDGIHFNVNGKRYLCNRIRNSFLNKITCTQPKVTDPCNPCSLGASNSTSHVPVSSRSNVVKTPVQTSTQTTAIPAHPIEWNVSPIVSHSAVPAPTPTAINTPSEHATLPSISSTAGHGVPSDINLSTSSIDTPNASQYVSLIDPMTPVNANGKNGPFSIPALGSIRKNIRNISNFQE